MTSNYDQDPFLQAAAGLVDDLKFKKAVEAGEMLEIHPGLHFVNEAGEMEFIGDHEAVQNDLLETYNAGYAAALEDQLYADED